MSRAAPLHALPLLVFLAIGCGPCTRELTPEPVALPPPVSEDSARPAYERRDLGEGAYLYIEGKSGPETFGVDLIEAMGALRSGALAAGIVGQGQAFALVRGEWDSGVKVRYGLPVVAIPTTPLAKPLQTDRLGGGDSIALRFEGPVGRLAKADIQLALAREAESITPRNDARIYWFPTLPTRPEASVTVVIEQAVGDPDETPAR